MKDLGMKKHDKVREQDEMCYCYQQRSRIDSIGPQATKTSKPQ